MLIFCHHCNTEGVVDTYMIEIGIYNTPYFMNSEIDLVFSEAFPTREQAFLLENSHPQANLKLCPPNCVDYRVCDEHHPCVDIY